MGRRAIVQELLEIGVPSLPECALAEVTSGKEICFKPEAKIVHRDVHRARMSLLNWKGKAGC
jgi:hypothetical protein